MQPLLISTKILGTCQAEHHLITRSVTMKLLQATAVKATTKSQDSTQRPFVLLLHRSDDVGLPLSTSCPGYEVSGDLS